MTAPIVLYNKPQLGFGSDLPALTVTGEFESYIGGNAYEGRLQINNSVGDCQVFAQSGTVLPPDAILSVDQATKEVVLRWLPSSPTPTNSIPNYSFEEEGGWSFGGGWSRSGFEYGTTGNYSAKNINFKGKSYVINDFRQPCLPGSHVNAQCTVHQDGGQDGWAGDGVALFWYDSNMNRFKIEVGDQYAGGLASGWHYTKISTVHPEGAAYVSIGAQCDRAHRNKPLYVDDFTWDQIHSVGSGEDVDYPIYLKVMDSLGRIAYWNGILSEYYLYATSALYPFSTVSDGLSSSSSCSGLNLRGDIFGLDGVYGAASVSACSLNPSIIYTTLGAPIPVPYEGTIGSSSAYSVVLTPTIVYTALPAPVPVPVEGVVGSSSVVASTLAVVIAYTTLAPPNVPIEGISGASSVHSVTLT